MPAVLFNSSTAVTCAVSGVGTFRPTLSPYIMARACKNLWYIECETPAVKMLIKTSLLFYLLLEYLAAFVRQVNLQWYNICYKFKQFTFVIWENIVFLTSVTTSINTPPPHSWTLHFQKIPPPRNQYIYLTSKCSFPTNIYSSLIETF